MGILNLLKANLKSIPLQKELETAIDNEDDKTIKIIITECISTILKAGLTKEQIKLLEMIDRDHKKDLNKLLSSAFQRGWVRNGSPNLSNAMDEVLLEAQIII